MAVTEVGMDTEVREVQEAKAPSPIAVTEVEMEAEEREVQSLKALSPMAVTVIGINTDVMAKHL